MRTRSLTALPLHLDSAILLTGVAVILLLMEHYGLHRFFLANARSIGFFAGMSRDALLIWSQYYFTAANYAGFVLLPVLYEKLRPAGDPNPFGLRLPPRPDLRVFGLIYAAILPVLLVAMLDPSLQAAYPMVKPESLSGLLVFEIGYLAQFFAVEFFFRGSVLYRLHSAVGPAAIGVMAIPYALFHIHKPLPEALGAIVTAHVLGALSLRSRSIWPGVALHAAAALTADLLALLYSGRLSALLAR